MTILEQLKRNRLVSAMRSALQQRRPIALSDINAQYDNQTLAVMRRVLRPDSNCVDIGAHQGFVLKEMIALASSGSHHAFEALPHLAAALRDAFPRVNIHELAVGDTQGEAEFQFVVNAPGYSGLRHRIYDRPDPRIQTIRVATSTLDAVIPADQPIAFIKIDIEGGEYHALRGAVDTIRRSRPVIVLEAGQKSTGQYGVTPQAMFSLVVDELGYRLSTMERWLRDSPAYTSEEFVKNWIDGPDFYFIATPADHARP